MKKITLLLSLSLFIPAISFAAQKPMVLCAAKDGTIKAKLKCTKKETKLNLNSLKGEKGDKGDTGSQGPRGPKGDKGDAGTGGAINSYSSMISLLQNCETRKIDGGFGGYTQYNYPKEVYVTAACKNDEMLYSWEFGSDSNSQNNETMIEPPVVVTTLNSYPGVTPGSIFVAFQSATGVYAIHPTVTIHCCKVQ